MTTHFTLNKYIGRDAGLIEDNLTEDQVIEYLLRTDDESLFQVTEWDSVLLDENGLPEIVDQLNGEEWLDEHLL